MVAILADVARSYVRGAAAAAAGGGAGRPARRSIRDATSPQRDAPS
jgi:hypothetical protein